MVDFKQFQKLDVTDDASAEYTFVYDGGALGTLRVRPASDANPDFFNAVLKANKRKSRAASKPTRESIAMARREDIRLFSKYIVIGWSSVQDAKGKNVPFSEDNCIEFLTAIPKDMFNDLRLFCLDINNFRECELMDQEELEELKGN